MKVLSLDTSNRQLTVAILDDDQILATETTTVHQKHAEYLLPIIDELMKKVDLTPSDLQRVVVADGQDHTLELELRLLQLKLWHTP